jgi:hypothetical protein
MKNKLILVLCALLVSSLSHAQEESLLQKQKNAFMSDAFHLFGYGQIVYAATEHPAPGNTNNSIEVARAILFATGKLGYKNQFGYMLMYDFSPNAKLHELYGEWSPVKAFHVRLGQYKIPFTLENPMSPTRIETINFSRSALAMCGSAGDVNQFDRTGNSIGPKVGRDAGLQLSGFLFRQDDFYRLEYYAGLFNGTGINTKDNDNHKDFIGTAYYQPIKNLRVGGSIYAGKLYNHTRDRWTAGAEYDGSRFYSRAEYISANDGGIKRQGYYGSLVWKWVPNKWEVLGKYDFYDCNTHIDRNAVHDLTAGINCYFAPASRIQLNYVYSDDQLNGKNNTVLAQLQLFF